MTNTQTPKLRAACDACHEAKVRCTRGTPCVHCKNHQHECHYSVAARIGKPKGSRNRKTLARLREQEAALHTAGATSSTSSSSSTAFPVGASYADATATPTWDLSSSYAQDQYAPYAWFSPPLIPATTPESRDLQCESSSLHHDLVVSHPSHSPSLHSTSSSVSHPGDVFSADNDSPGYPPSFSAPACGCFQWHTSSVASLQTLRSQAHLMQHDTFDQSLQCVGVTFAACQRTAACHSCEKDSASILFLIASLQMAIDQLQSMLFAEIKNFTANNPMIGIAPSVRGEPGTLRPMQLRHMLLKGQTTLQDLRNASELARLLPHGRRVSDSMLLASNPNDPEYMWLVFDRLQAEIDTLLGTIGRYLV